MNRFQKRKKEEKRRQAHRQIRRAYKEWQTNASANRFNFPISMKPEIEPVYSTIDISKAFGMPRERLRDWMDRGFIKPSLPSTGQGTIAIFTTKDVYRVFLFEKLVDAGLKRQTAGPIATNANFESAEAFTILIADDIGAFAKLSMALSWMKIYADRMLDKLMED